MMQEVLYIEEISQAEALLKPKRLELLKNLAEPHSCPELAMSFDESPQKIYYHVKVLQNAGLVERVEERKVRGILEGIYQAKAKSYWLSPKLVGRIGSQRRVQDQMSLSFLLNLAEELQDDVGHLAETQIMPIASLGLTAQIELSSPERRVEFLAEVQSIFKKLAQKYGRTDSKQKTGNSSEIFKLMLACYPDQTRQQQRGG